MKVCSAEGCERKHKANGYCAMHNALVKRNGSLFRKRRPNGDPAVQLANKQYYAAYKNTPRYRAYLSARKSRFKQATPDWVNQEELRAIYLHRPDGCHVDHIVPLNGKKVSGLHVPWNLQYLEAKQNMKKRNHFVGLATDCGTDLLGHGGMPQSY